MREFFIGAFEKLVAVIIVIMALVVLGVGLATMFGGGTMGPGGQRMGGFFPGLLILIVGAVYVIFIGGAMYLGLGIYQNTKRSAELLEQIARK